MEVSGGTRERIPALDGLRALAIFAVFLKHSLKVRMMWMGVDLFFVLSGFLITGILLDLKHKDLKSYFRHFYGRRIRRIMPPYLMILVVASLLFGFAWTSHWYLYLGLTNYIVCFPGPQLKALNPLWSLGVEEQFYLLWPFAVFFLSEKRLLWVALSLMILAPIFRVLMIPYDTVHQIVYMGTPFRMDCLAMGALMTLAWRRYSTVIRRYGYLGLIGVVLTPILMLKLSRMGGWSTMDGTIYGNIFTYEIAMFTATGVFLWGLGGRFTWLLETPPLQFFGRISYSFYLIHATALIFWNRYVSNIYGYTSLALITATLYAAASWYFIEKPILGGGNRRVKRVEVLAAHASTGSSA